MLKLDVLRLFVDQRLTAATDDIFRLFAKTIAEYEDEVYRSKQEIDRQRRLLEARAADTPGDAPGDAPGGGLQIFTPEEEEQMRGRSFTLHIKEEVSGEAEDFPEVFSVKQEVGEGHMMLEAAVRTEISCQQEDDTQVFNTEEEQQVGGWSHQLVKQEVGGAAAEPEESDANFTQSLDWLMESGGDDDGGSSSNQIQSHRGEGLLLSGDAVQSESSAEDAAAV
ncbi:uncharacterized protein LOC128374537 [Scomber japonicus]|uniref:uncharacterized protein LOC128374537 n=1 Tax=Scomber japonicus TaxID=13676 RepID=UPI002305FC06|nr:uncharacterized protein LOC128374537 [Scomber japonicus]